MTKTRIPGKTPTSFRFSKETNRLLKILCESWGVNRNEAVERAIVLSTFMDKTKLKIRENES